MRRGLVEVLGGFVASTPGRFANPRGAYDDFQPKPEIPGTNVATTAVRRQLTGPDCGCLAVCKSAVGRVH
jgi:hypothetical protein